MMMMMMMEEETKGNEEINEEKKCCHHEKIEKIPNIFLSSRRHCGDEMLMEADDILGVGFRD